MVNHYSKGPEILQINYKLSEYKLMPLMYFLIYTKVRCACISVLYHVTVFSIHNNFTYWVHSSFLKPWVLILVNMRQFQVQSLKRMGTTTLLQSGLSGVLYNVTMSGDIFALGENEMNQWTKGSIYLIYRGKWGKGNREAHYLRRSKGIPFSSHVQVF